MRNWFHLAALSLALIFAGCAHHQESAGTFQSFPDLGLPAGTNSATTVENGNVIVTPADGLNGKVTRVDFNLKYVVLTFPVGQMASVNQRLNISRGGLKVGEVKVAGPQLNTSIVADIVAGEAEIGDDARDK